MGRSPPPQAQGQGLVASVLIFGALALEPEVRESPATPGPGVRCFGTHLRCIGPQARGGKELATTGLGLRARGLNANIQCIGPRALDGKEPASSGPGVGVRDLGANLGCIGP